MLFTATVLSSDDKCVAQLKSPPAIEGKKLRFVQVLTRHGARAPLQAFVPKPYRGYWLCDADDALSPRMHAAPVEHYRRFKQIVDYRLIEFLPNCRAGDLLLAGMSQHQKLGSFYHDYLWNNSLFDSLPVDPNQIYVRVSDVERTLRSAQAFLHGAFPPQSPNEIIEIETDSDDGSVLRTNKEWCSELKDSYVELNGTTEYQNWVKENWEKLGNLPGQLGFTEMTDDNLNAVCDFISTSYCDDKQLPAFIENQEDIQNTCLKVSADFIYKLYQHKPMIPASYTVREMLRHSNNFINKANEVKFSLLSAHDTTVGAVYTLLGGVQQDRIPPYASHLSMELWSSDEKPDEYTVRFALNGEEIQLRELDNKTQVLYSEFVTAYKGIEDYCKSFP